MEDLRTKAKYYKRIKSYDKAVEIYSQIYSEDCDKWLRWEYAYCLKQLGEYDEAINICKSIYEEDKLFKYNNDLLSWLLYEKYYKVLKEKYTYKEINQLFDIAIFVSNLVKQDETSPYEKIMLKTLKALKRNLKNPEDKILIILEKLDCNKLSDSAPTRKVNDREQEYQSDKEMYFAYKTKALYDSKKYNDCIICCDEALNSINRFHHSNDIWIRSRKYLCIGELDSYKNAINELIKISSIKDHWIFYSDIAHLYQKNGDDLNALLYYCRAAITKDPPSMKVALYYEMAQLLKLVGDNNNANLHAMFAVKTRNNEDWHIPDDLKLFTKENKDDPNNIQIEMLQQFWINKIYEILGLKSGQITKLHQNGKFGFITADKESYYFKAVSAVGKYRVRQGDKVKFCLIDSYDKSKDTMTKEAAYLQLDK